MLARPTIAPRLARLVPALAAVAFVLAACGASNETATSGPGTISPSAGAIASDSNGPAATVEPSAGSPSGPDLSTASASNPPSSAAAPSATDPGTGPAAGCSGSDANRDFFVGAAGGVDWQVYCAVLPDGWFVQTGSYRLRDGGVLRIAYSGPDGARIELREGGICLEDPACVPSGTAAGSAAFGDRSGVFLVLDGGGYAVSVDGGQPVSWLVIGANMDEAAFRSIASALQLVAVQ